VAGLGACGVGLVERLVIGLAGGSDVVGDLVDGAGEGKGGLVS
jgi:hypothetical protein